MYQLEPETQGATLTLHLKGSVLIPDVVAFNKVMREYSKLPNISQLILDMSSVEKMDQSGLGVLVSLNTSMQRYGRRLVLSHLPSHIEQLLKDAEIEGFFPTVESEEELRGYIQESQKNR